MEVYCVKVEYEGIRVSNNSTCHILWSSLEGAKESLKRERDYILQHNPWLNNENCIEKDEDEYFYVHDDDDYYTVTISKETVHD